MHKLLSQGPEICGLGISKKKCRPCVISLSYSVQELTRSSFTTVSSTSSFPLSQGWKYLKPCNRNGMIYCDTCSTSGCVKNLYDNPPVMNQAEPGHLKSAAVSSSAPSPFSRRKENISIIKMSPRSEFFSNLNLKSLEDRPLV